MDTPALATDFVNAANAVEDLLTALHWIENDCIDIEAARGRAIMARRHMFEEDTVEGDQ